MLPSDVPLGQSVTQIYRDHHSWLNNWLKRKLGNGLDAADLAQDTFVRLLKSSVVTSLGNEPRAFLTHIAKGLIVDHWRRYDVEQAYLAAIAHLPLATAPSPETRLTPSGSFNVDGRTMSRFFFEQKENFNSTFNMIELEAKFNTGSLAHKTLIGSDYYEATSRAPFVFTSFTDVDVYQPTYGSSKPNLPLSRNNFSNDWNGVYVQDQIQVAPKWHLLVGGRYDQAKTVNESASDKSTTNDEKFTPRTGIVFSMSPEVSVYGSYTESFGAANSGLSFTGKAFKPEAGKQYETGIKSELLDGRLGANVALYHLTKQNVLTSDLANPGFSVQAGEARSRGIEVDISGEVTPQFNLLASYTYTDAKFTKDNDGNQGNQLSGAPKQAVSLWGKYRLLGQLNGLTLGGGFIAQGERQGDDANTFTLPGFTRFDAFMAYRWKTGNHQLTTQVNVENLFDKEYFNASGSRAEIHPGNPRKVMASVGIDF